MLPSFLQNLALEEAFEPVVWQNKKTIEEQNSNTSGMKKIKVLIDRFFHIVNGLNPGVSVVRIV